jgi:hypothetical protein
MLAGRAPGQHPVRGTDCAGLWGRSRAVLISSVPPPVVMEADAKACAGDLGIHSDSAAGVLDGQ